MALRELPAGQYYVLSRNQGYMDHHGNIYGLGSTPTQVSVPHVAVPTPTKAKDWREGLPTVVLNAESLALISALKEGLSHEPVEHVLAIGIDIAGDVCFEHWQHGDGVHCEVDYEGIVAKAKESRATGVSLFHNHPYPHEAIMSTGDKQVTAALERKLAREYIVLNEHSVVKGKPADARISAAEEPPTLWELAQLKESALWHAYGGSNPYRR